MRTSNKRVLENLICAGAFDTLPGTRTQKYNELSHVIDKAIEIKKRKETGQMSMFSLESDTDSNEFYQYQPCQAWTEKEKLEKEKEVLGFYISSHPLSNYKNPIEWLNIQEISHIQQKYQNNPPGGTEPIVLICGLLSSKKIITTKKGDRMAFLQVDDLQSSAEIIVFPRLFTKIESYLHDHSIFIIKGALDTMSTGTCKILANEICPIDLFFEKWPNIEMVTLFLPIESDLSIVQKIKEKLTFGKIKLQIIFKEHNTTMSLKTHKNFALALDLLNELALEHDIKVNINF